MNDDLAELIDDAKRLSDAGFSVSLTYHPNPLHSPNVFQLSMPSKTEREYQIGAAKREQQMADVQAAFAAQRASEYNDAPA